MTEVGPQFPGPVHKEKRRDFPRHGDKVFPVLTAEEARRRARENLERWRREHEQRD